MDEAGVGSVSLCGCVGREDEGIYRAFLSVGLVLGRICGMPVIRFLDDNDGEVKEIRNDVKIYQNTLEEITPLT